MPNINVIVDEKTKSKIEFLVKLNNSVIKPPKKKSDGVSQISIINGLLEEYFERADNAKYLRLFEERGEFGAMLEIQETLRTAEKEKSAFDSPSTVKSGGGRNE